MEPKPSNAMRVSTVLVLAVAVGACFVAPATSTGAAVPICDQLGPLVPPSVPAALAAPSGAMLAKRVHAVGVQIYTCTPPTGGGATASYTWALKVPDAKLYDTSCTLVGTHGAGPSWRSEADGSTVVGGAVASVDAPDKHMAIPWLLLKAVSHTGTGVMSDVIAVQRVDTQGGVAPTSGCDAAHVGSDTSVVYTATYYFYTGKRRDAAGDASDGD
jgi:Protein of unknown function (DUF3455)